MGVELFFHRTGFGDEDFFFDVGMDAEILFEGLKLGQEDTIEGRVCLGWVVQVDGLADVFQFVFRIVVIAEELADGIIAAGDQEAGELSGRLFGFPECLNIREQQLFFCVNMFGQILDIPVEEVLQCGQNGMMRFVVIGK